MADAAIRSEILARMAAGESLRSVCKTDGFPAPSTVMDWVNADKDFAAAYQAAVEQRADVYFDRLDDVSDAAEKVTNAAAVPGLRLKADNIKWQLARMSPKRYGDKLQTEHTGPGGGAVQVETSERPKLTPDQWLAAHGLKAS